MHIVECDADVVLVSSLISVSPKRVLHSNGKHQVMRRLIYKQESSMGMIDEDPHTIVPKKFFERFIEIDRSNTDGLILLEYRRRKNRLVILCPRLEEWIIESARGVKLNLRNYNLPNNGNALHAVINFKLNRFRELVEDLKKHSPRVKALQRLLT